MTSQSSLVQFESELFPVLQSDEGSSCGLTSQLVVTGQAQRVPVEHLRHKARVGRLLSAARWSVCSQVRLELRLRLHGETDGSTLSFCPGLNLFIAVLFTESTYLLQRFQWLILLL